MKNYMKPSDKEETLLCIKVITGCFSKRKANKTLHLDGNSAAPIAASELYVRLPHETLRSLRIMDD